MKKDRKIRERVAEFRLKSQGRRFVFVFAVMLSTGTLQTPAQTVAPDVVRRVDGVAWSAREALPIAPEVLWEEPTPSGLGNSIQGAGWSPGKLSRVAIGSTDRWLRVRDAGTGKLIYSVLQPHRSGGVDQTIYSMDGSFLAVHNRSGGLGYRVHRGLDGYFIGTLAVTVDSNGLVRFAPDAQLSALLPGAVSLWRIADFTVVLTTGSGYDRVTTVFNFSPDGVFQSAASRATITIRRRSDGSIFRSLSGGSVQGFTPVAFTMDSAGIAAWAASPNQTTLWRISDGVRLMQFRGAVAEEGIVALRFTPDGARLVTTGYLPYPDPDGLWQQKGIIRFWRVLDGAKLADYSEHTGLAVTSPVAWSPDGSRFIYGTYEGTVVAARTPTP